MASKYENHVTTMLYFTLVFLPWVGANLGILYATNNASSQRFCMSYNPQFSNISTDFEHAVLFPLKILIPNDGCNFTSSVPLSDKIIMVNKGGCSLARKALNVQDEGGKGLVVAYPNLGMPTANESRYQEINITIAIIEEPDALKLVSMGSYIEVAFFAITPSTLQIDYSIFGIFIMAMFVVIVGGVWSGIFKHQLYVAETKNTTDNAPDTLPSSQGRASSESISLDVGPIFILIFVLMMCGMLLLLYFFFNYLVYIIIGMFCLTSSFSLFCCLAEIVNRLPCKSICRFSVTWPKSGTLDIKLLLLFAFSFSFGVCWVVYRNASFSWILQDILGIAFCIHALKMFRLPNLKVCVVLLCLLLAYDIFFVFITPLFTKTGESVMVEVATGGISHSSEQLPVVLRIPHFNFDDESVCHFAYSLLGFGDLLIPGLLISYCHSFDLKVNNYRRVYFVSTVIAYGIGLILTFVALALMQEGQPALLYLVPCTLLTVLCIGWKKGDLKHLWTGEITYSEEPEPIHDSAYLGVDPKISEPYPIADKQQLID